MRAIKIDATARTVTEFDFDYQVGKPGAYRAIYPVLGPGVGTFECVYLSDTEVLYVDEEGLLKNPEHFFVYKGFHQPLAGNGLILGTNDEGEAVATKLSLEEVKARVTFPNIQLDGFGPSYETVTDHPALGPNTPTFVASPPIFSKK